MVRIAVLLVGIALTPTTSQAQEVFGSIVDTTGGTKVNAAEVLVLQEGSSSSSISDSVGKFRIAVKPGKFRIHVRALGFGEVDSDVYEIEQGSRLTLVVYLSKDPVVLPSVVAVAISKRPKSALDQFEDRMRKSQKTGMGYFFDRTAIERRVNLNISDVLSRIPGARTGADFVSLRPHCSDALYLLDGVPVRSAGIPGGSSRIAESATRIINSSISVTDVAGIEVYKSLAEVPAQLAASVVALAGSGSCGVVAIWTRR